MIISYTNPIDQSVVLLPQSLLNALFAVVKQHYPLEFGGIFTGCKFNNIYLIVDFAIPESFKSTGSNFTRETEDLNKYLKDIYDVSNGKIEYLGEWHSHPDGSTQFSAKDQQSMREIAEEAETKNEYPLLFIIGISQNNNAAEMYRYIKNDLIRLNT